MELLLEIAKHFRLTLARHEAQQQSPRKQRRLRIGPHKSEHPFKPQKANRTLRDSTNAGESPTSGREGRLTRSIRSAAR